VTTLKISRPEPLRRPGSNAKGSEASPAPPLGLEAIARNEARQSWFRECVEPFDSVDWADSRELAGLGLVTDELERQDDPPASTSPASACRCCPFAVTPAIRLYRV
jgi:hypothetical protein